MAILGLSTYEENDDASTPKSATKKLRWATQHKKGRKGNRKRLSILDRLHKRGSQNSEKKRNSGGSLGTDLDEIQEEEETEAQDEPGEDNSNEGPRTVFFNIPLPADA